MKTAPGATGNLAGAWLTSVGVPPLHPGDPGEGRGDDHEPEPGDGAPDGGDADDEADFRPPLPPEDRIWRHPSEIALSRARHEGGASPRRTAGLMALSAVAGAAVAVVAMSLVGVDERVVERRVPARPAAVVDADGERDGPHRALRSVAAVVVARDGTEVTGTAVVLRSDGYLVADVAVVGGAERVEVVLPDGPVLDGTVVGSDELTGVAVVRVDTAGLQAADLGRSAGLVPGDATSLVAVGPDGAVAVSEAVVSATAGRAEGPDGEPRYGMILVGRPFAGTLAGGALVDDAGDVVGIASALRSSQSAQQGVATPIELVDLVAAQIIEDGRAHHVWLGLHGTDHDGGAIVDEVVPDGPAHRAGVRAGDLVVSVDGEPVPSMAALIVALRLHRPGETVLLGLRRDEGRRAVRVELSARPSDPEAPR